MTRELGLVLQLVRNRNFFQCLAFFFEDLHFHFDQVNNTAKRIINVFGPQADRHLNRHRIATQALANLIDDTVETGAFPIQFIDEGKSRHLVTVGLSPDGFTLRLNTFTRAEHDHRAIQYTQRSFDFGGKIYVTGCVDQVDVDIFPLERHAG